MDAVIDVLFDEGDIVVVDKPAGVATLPGTGVTHEETLLGALRDAFEVEPGFAGPGVFGRLDRPTSGLVVASLSRAGHALLEPHWSGGAIRKDYLLVVHGATSPRGRIDVPLAARRPRHKGSGRVEAALTTFVRVASGSGLSVVVARIHTGRTHQIRRHMKAIGHPIVGDSRYGHVERDEAMAAAPLGLMLHAWRLSHMGGVPLFPARITAPAPERIVTCALAHGLALPDPGSDLPLDASG